MRKARRITSNFIFASCFGVAAASGDVFFSDNFENQTIPLSPPPVGFEYDLAGTTGSPFSLSNSPAIGNTSLKLIRDGVDNPTINARTNDGLMTDGAVVEFSWANNLEHVHRFNAPVQVQLGMVNGGVGRLVFIGVNDPGNGAYFYTDQNGNQVNTGVRPSLNTPGANENRWDRLRAVLTLDIQDFGQLFMTGTMNLFVSLDGAPEQQLANNVPLAFGEIPSDDPMTPGWDESTAALMKIQKGPFSGSTYYDNLLVQTPGGGPQPTAWNVDADGNWSVGSNWSPTTPPNAAGAIANFGPNITAPRTVTVDAPQTVGTMNFSSGISYNIVGSALLTMDDATSATIDVSAGSHLVSAPVQLNKGTQVNVAASSSLTVSGGIDAAAGVALSKAGAGELNIGRATVSTLNVNAGTVRMQPNGTNSGLVTAKSLSVDSSARLDVTNNAIVVDYDTSDPSAAVRAALASGYAAGSWNGNGINSSAAASTAGHAVGYAQASDVSPGAIFGTVDATAVLIRYTRLGDANLSGTTDIADFSLLASNFNVASGEWNKGDFNYDGTTNIGDFALLAGNFNQSIAAVGARSAVPEPTLGGAVVLTALLAHRRVRRV